MRHYPCGQPAHIRVIRRRSRLPGCGPTGRRSVYRITHRPLTHAAPLGWARGVRQGVSSQEPL
jgi:hypothetical protein